MVNFVQKSNIFWKFLEIANDSNSGTECARDMKFVSRCVVFNTPVITQFRPKVDLGPFGNELFI